MRRPLGSGDAVGRTIGPAIVAVVIGLPAALVLVRAVAGLDLWDPYVPSFWPPFGDLRSITGGWDCVAAGVAIPELSSVDTPNACDPWGRPYNYPRVWLWPSFLGALPGAPGAVGVGDVSTLVLALVVLATFAAGLVRLVGSLSWRRGWPVLVAVLSPSVLLGVERGNNELFAVGLVALAAAVPVGRPRRAAGLVLGAGVAKLLPFAALPALLARRDRNVRGLAVALVAVAVVGWALLLSGDLARMDRATPRGFGLSFGLLVLRVAGVPVWATAVLSLGALAVGWTWSQRLVAWGEVGDVARSAFVAGTSVLLVAYLTGGTHADYRLAWMLLWLPLLVGREGRDRPVPGSRTIVATVLAALFLARPSGVAGIPVDEVLALVLVFGAVGAVGAWAVGEVARVGAAARASG